MVEYVYKCLGNVTKRTQERMKENGHKLRNKATGITRRKYQGKKLINRTIRLRFSDLNSFAFTGKLEKYTKMYFLRYMQNIVEENKF